jgi:hypothetical protein
MLVAVEVLLLVILQLAARVVMAVVVVLDKVELQIVVVAEVAIHVLDLLAHHILMDSLAAQEL